jgi:hypothetical protein
VRAPKRHAFRFKVSETGTVLVAWANVRKASKKVVLNLTADDVRRSMRLGGVGNTQTCSMAVCAKRQASQFPHKVEGYIDWQYRRAYVVTRVSKKTGLPVECVVYEHRDKIAQLNDSKGGQQKLLKELEANGDRSISLLPPLQRTYPPNRPHNGNRTGKNSSKPVSLGHGAKLRFAVAMAGGVPS